MDRREMNQVKTRPYLEERVLPLFWNIFYDLIDQKILLLLE